LSTRRRVHLTETFECLSTGERHRKTSSASCGTLGRGGHAQRRSNQHGSWPSAVVMRRVRLRACSQSRTTRTPEFTVRGGDETNPDVLRRLPHPQPPEIGDFATVTSRAVTSLERRNDTVTSRAGRAPYLRDAALPEPTPHATLHSRPPCLASPVGLPCCAGRGDALVPEHLQLLLVVAI
jgi:hypothetical protein